MGKNKFFDTQSDLTAAKILIYQQYLRSFLPKVLIQFGICFIVDFFCGCGKNGEKDGSPLVLLNVAKEILEDSVVKLKRPDAKVVIVFNDNNRKFCDDLKVYLDKIGKVSNIEIRGPFCEDFSSAKTRIVDELKMNKAPKFFFLDPFTYSKVDIVEIKELMNLGRAEVLLFLPVFHSYRFASGAEKIQQLKFFLEKFTTKGCAEYRDIYEFIESIKEKMLSDLELKYVREIGLNAGTKKNALFYLTKHEVGMLTMNKIACKYADDGIMIKVGKDYKPSLLFDTSFHTPPILRQKELFESFIRSKKRVTNNEIIDYSAVNGLDTSKYTKVFLQEMEFQDKIKVEYIKYDKKRGFYVGDANWNQYLCDIVYVGVK